MMRIRKYVQKLLIGPAVLVALIFSVPQMVFPQDTVSNCVTCHSELDEQYALPVTLQEHDIHYTNGITCVDCHGGDSQIDPEDDPSVAMDPAKGFTGAISRFTIPELCNSCHGNGEYMKTFNPNVRLDQFQRYQTSTHGKLLAEGDENVAVCTDCHKVHQIRSVKDPASGVYPLSVSTTCGRCHSDAQYMQSYGIPTDQDTLYQQSVHYEYLHERGDLSAPTCNDCHGNHGAVPPGIDNIHFVCGTCHVSNKELFDKSAHFQAFKEMEMPECVTCHSNHDILRTGEYMLRTEGGVCWDCHDTDSDEGRTILQITAEIDSLKHLSEQADSLITLAEKKGMEVGEYRYQLLDLNTKIQMSQTLVHTLSLPAVQEETHQGDDLATSILEGGISAMAEIAVRRTGLFISLLFVLLVIIALFFKIRSLSKT